MATSTTTARTIKLPRLPIGWQSQPQLFERYWDEAMTNIEKTLNSILSIPEIQNALNNLSASSQQQSIATSFPVNLTLTATADGKIQISDHIRRYTDGHADVNVTGTIISTGLSAGDVRSIGYDDPTRVGGAVTYVLTVADVDAHVSTTNPGRHYVGSVQIPDSTTTTPSQGSTAAPPGASSTTPAYQNFDGGTAEV